MFVASLALIGRLAAAQSVGTGTIIGKVADESGAPMPGVTVTVSSPALQLREIAEVSGADGTYRLVDLPIGIYSVKYELTGFQSIVREEVRLTAGFTARLDIVLKVGAISETLVVSGQSPVIDTSSTTGTVSFTKETLENAPTSRAFADVLSMAPGFRAAGVDVGGSELSEQRVGVRNYGTSGQITPQLEGINTRQASGSAGFFYDYSAVEEAQIQAVGNDAEVALPGGAWNAIVKSGGDEFHGRYSYAGQTKSLQSGNVDEELRAQGVDPAGSGMRWYSDAAADLGGRIIRSRLWFYAALHDQRSEENLIGFSKETGPDGRFFTADDVPGYDRSIVTNQTIKSTFQATSKYKVVGFFQRNEKIQPNGQTAGRFEPFPATYNYSFPTRATKGEFTGTPSDKLLFNVMAGRQWYDANRFPQEGENRAGNPRMFNRETGTSLGPQPDAVASAQPLADDREPVALPREAIRRLAQLEDRLPVLLGGGRHGVAIDGGGRLSAHLRRRQRRVEFAGGVRGLQQPDSVAGQQGDAVFGVRAGQVEPRPPDDQHGHPLGPLSRLRRRAGEGAGHVRQRRGVSRRGRPDLVVGGAACGRRVGHRRQRQDRGEGEPTAGSTTS